VRIGIPAEIKDSENRVALTPAVVRELVARGHAVGVQRGAGRSSGFADEDYTAVGATLIEDVESLWALADLVVKVKEPIPDEYRHFRDDLVIFTYLHLASSEALTRALVESGCTAIAYETIASAGGHLPLLAPMSRIAGCMAAQVAACELYSPRGGNGTLVGGVPGVPAARATVLGGGMAGYHAARLFAALGGQVTVLDVDLDRLDHIDRELGVATLPSNPTTVEEQIAPADVVIGAVLLPGAKAPKLLSVDAVRSMQPRSVFIDVSIDQGGCAETSRPTTHSEPTYVEHDVLHYCVANMPGAVPRVSTPALANVTARYVYAIADRGVRDAIRDDAGFAQGVAVAGGHVTHAAVAEAHSMERADVFELV
jgi:alanine dehydrogenase